MGSSGKPLSVHVDVTNQDERAGDEVVLGYVRDLVSSTTTPVRALKQFQRISLRPGETRTVALEIESEQLALLDQNLRWVVEPGRFQIWVGDQTARFEVAAE